MRFLKTTLYSIIALLFFGAVALYFAYGRNLYVGIDTPPDEIFIQGGMLFDAVDGNVILNPGIVLKEGIITCVGSHCESSENAQLLDATNLSILPGLVELHGHFFARTKDNAQLSVPALIWNTAQAKPDV